MITGKNGNRAEIPTLRDGTDRSKQKSAIVSDSARSSGVVSRLEICQWGLSGIREVLYKPGLSAEFKLEWIANLLGAVELFGAVKP